MFIYKHMRQDACMRSFELLPEKVWPNFTDKIAAGSNLQRSAG